MPPGAAILMRGLGMRGTGRYIKNRKRGSKESGAYDRPKVFWHDGDGDNCPVPPQFSGDERFGIPPYITDGDTALATFKYLENPSRSSGGLPEDYLWRLFEYERSQWARQGFISPYKKYRDRAARDVLEFTLWRHWHPNQEDVEVGMNEDDDQRYGRPHDFINDEPQPYGRLPRGHGYDDHRPDQEQYRQRRSAASYNRPPYRKRGRVDHRDPRNCPPYPRYGINQVRRGAHRPPLERFEVRRDRHQRRYSTPGGFQGPKGRTPYSEYDIPRNRAQQRPFGPPIRDYCVPARERGGSRVYGGYEPQREEIPAFIPPDLRRYPHGLDYEHDEDEDEEEAGSQYSNQSFVRNRRHRHRRPPSPRIIYESLPPYYGRPRGHGRHEDDIDDEFVDGLFHGRGAHMGRGRRPYSIGREAGRFRMGRRSYDDEGLDYGFSGDEDDDDDF